jgi:Tol biopolymer transport system component
MTTRYTYLVPMSLLLCAAACDPLHGDDDPSGDDDSSGAASDSDDPSATGDPATTAATTDDPGSDSDPTGADPTGSDPTGSDPTGEPGDPLAGSVLLFLHDDGNYSDSVHAYDIASDQTWLVTDFGGNVEARSVAIHPDRTRIAIASYYEISDPDESEGIWGMPAAGGEPQPIMDAWEGDAGEVQDVGDLAYSADGAYIYFDHSTSTTGGGVIARVAADGGVPELFLDANGTCTANAGPAPDPSGTQMLSVRSGCVDLELEGLVLNDLPPTGIGQVAIPEGTSYDLPFVAPQWSADGSAVLFVMGSVLDIDGDGTNDGQGESVVLWDIAGGQVLEVVPAAVGQRIYNFAVSPDERYLAMCMASAAGQDLVLADLGGEAISYRALTTDGNSCHVAW